MPTLDKTGPGEQGCCGRRDGGGHRHGDGGQCCGGKHSHDEAALSREEEIAALEQQIAGSRARLDELRRG